MGTVVYRTVFFECVNVILWQSRICVDDGTKLYLSIRMTLLETLPASRIVAFPSEIALLTYLRDNPCVRNLGRIVRQKSAVGQSIVLLVDMASEADVIKADQAMMQADAMARRSYQKAQRVITEYGYDWEAMMRRNAKKFGYNAADTEIFLATMRKEKFGVTLPYIPSVEEIERKKRDTLGQI